MRKPGRTRRLINRLGIATVGQMREAITSLQMAVVNRLTASWTTTTLSPDSQARLSQTIVRNRSRQLVQDVDYANKFVIMGKTNVLGEKGIHFRCGAKEPDLVKGNKLIPGAPDAYARKVIEDGWWEWGRKQNCTMHGTLTWCDSQKVALEAAMVDGECIARKVKGAPNKFGFALRFYDAEQLDENLNQSAKGEFGNEIRMGVEIDQFGKPLFYHLLKQVPSENYYWRGSRMESERVPADEIIHLGIKRRHNQTRFLPWLSTSGYRLNMVGKYEESEAVAARSNACKRGFFVRENASAEYTGQTDADGKREMDMQPGMWDELPPGMKPVAIDSNHPSTAYGDFLKTALRGVAAGLGVSYNSLANDMESVNFASGKLGLFEERELWKIVQDWFIESFCEEVFSAWLESAILSGSIPLPARKFDKFNHPIFRGRRWADIDPVKEQAARVSRMNSGMTSLTSELAALNIDRDEHLDQIKADKDAMESRGLEFIELMPKTPIDEGRSGNKTGSDISEDDEAEDNKDD